MHKLNTIALLSILLAAIGLTMGGCLTSDRAAAGDFGPAPTNSQELAKAWLDANLKDSESARIKYGELVKCAIMDGLIYGGGVRRGWVQMVECNSKNSFGGYTGWQQYALFIDGGRISGDVSFAIANGQMAQLVR